jgi:hypothetical protein
LNARTALGIEFVALDALRQAQARASKADRKLDR